MPNQRQTLKLLHVGKVRELYELPDADQLLVVATDRVSAYDHVLTNEIEGKGSVLTQLTQWWAEQLADIMPSHLSEGEIDDDLAGRAAVVEKLDMVGVECVMRGYLAGSGWADYERTGAVLDHELPSGLQFGSRLPQPIFTPARKAPAGEHDENLTYQGLVDLVGDEMAGRLAEATRRLYVRAERIAREHGLVLADTKFEFGVRPDGELVLADEILTPDSSRYWDLEAYRAGGPLTPLDKQVVRDWLANHSGWSPSSDEEPPALPDDVVEATKATYAEVFRRLTGREVEVATPLVRKDAADGVAGTEPQEADVDEPKTSFFVVDVMPKQEILDPQGKAITGALARMGHPGFTVRQGKRFEITADGEATDETIAAVENIAETLLANTVIEDFEITLYTDDCGCGPDCDCGEDCDCGCAEGGECGCHKGDGGCDCGPDCQCGCQDGKPCTCHGEES